MFEWIDNDGFFEEEIREITLLFVESKKIKINDIWDDEWVGLNLVLVWK